MKRAVIDGANVAYAYQKVPTHKKKFSYEAYPVVAKEICQHYGVELILTMPQFRFKELRKKCMDDALCDLIEKMVDKGIIHLTGNAPGDDDREAQVLAMSLNAYLITNDKKMIEHFDRYPNEQRPDAEKWFLIKRKGFFFYKSKMILMDCIPTCLKKRATA